MNAQKTVKNALVDVKSMDFGVDKSILRNLILQQAGSLQKALIELVMNELDAKATDIHITIDQNMKRITVEGNGRGFTSVKDIEKHFGTFGFAHDSQEEEALGRQYGRYGLGRGQIFAFGATHWETNTFSMDVDFKSWNTQKEDLPYTLKIYQDSLYNGCKITIDLYKTISLWERNSLENELKRMLSYTSQKIYLNQSQINTEPQDAKWTHKHGELRFKLSSGTGGLTIYNQGVLVTTLRHSLFGVSGELTSVGKAFDVNMARNDIQQTTCTLWPQLKAFLTPIGAKKRKSALTDEDREHVLRNVFTGQTSLVEVLKMRLIPVISGQYITINQMLNHAEKKLTLAPKSFSNTGETLHKLKRVTVISPGLLNTLNIDTVEMFIDMLIKAGKDELERLSFRGSWELMKIVRDLEQVTFLSFETVALAFKEQNEVMDQTSFSSLDKVKFKALENLTRRVALDLVKTAPRKLQIGISETALGWTDGSTFIAIEKKIFKEAFSNGMSGLLKLIHILVHEYLHNLDSGIDHSHDKDFYLAYHDTTITRYGTIMVLAQSVFTSYLNGRKRSGLGILRSEVQQMYGSFNETLMMLLNSQDVELEDTQQEKP